MSRTAVEVGLALGLVVLVVIALLGSRLSRRRGSVAALRSGDAALRQRDARASVDDEAMELSGTTSGRVTRLFTTRGDRDAVLEREAQDQQAVAPAQAADDEPIVEPGQVPGWGVFDARSPEGATPSSAPEIRW